MLLIDGDSQSREKIFKKIDQLGPFISVLAYIAGLVYFVALPHEALIHRTYISENALLPGIYSFSLAFLSITNYFAFDINLRACHIGHQLERLVELLL